MSRTHHGNGTDDVTKGRGWNENKAMEHMARVCLYEVMRKCSCFTLGGKNGEGSDRVSKPPIKSIKPAVD